MASLNHGNFLDIINTSFFDRSQENRSMSEHKLTQFMSNSPDHFVLLCTQFFSDSRTPLNLRKTIATVLKLAVKPLAENRQLSIWTKIQPENKLKIQECGLINLMDEDNLIKAASASLVADVFALDCLSDRQWIGLLPSLSNNLEHKDPAVQKSAIMTLGYICEVLHEENINVLSQKELDCMTTGICKKLTNYDENTLTALKSLEFSLNYLSESLRQEGLADFIMNLITNVLILSIEKQDCAVMRQVVNVMGELTKILFLVFKKYSNFVFDKLIECYNSKDKDTIISLNEYFMSLIKLEEANNQFIYSEALANRLLEKCIESMLHLLSNEFSYCEEEDIPELQISCIYLMSSINTHYIDFTIENLYNFIKAYIEKKDILSRVIALTVLNSIISVPGDLRISNIISEVFFGLAAYLNETSIRVKISSSNVLRKIAKYYPKLFMNEKFFTRIFQVIMDELDSNSQRHKMIESLIFLIDELCENFHKLDDKEQNLLQANEDILLISLLNSLNTNGCEMYFIDRIFSTTMKIFQTMIPPENLSKWFEYLWNLFLNRKSSIQVEENLFYVNCVFINLNVITQFMIENEQDFNVDLDKKKDLINHLFESVFELFEIKKEIIDEPLLFLSTLIDKEKKLVEIYIPTFIEKYISHALRDISYTNLFVSGLSCMGELIKSYKDKMAMYIKSWVPKFLQYLNDASISKDMKIRLFFVISDIIGHCPSVILPYLEDIIILLKSAFDAVLTLQKNPDSESRQYSDGLKLTLIELISCAIHGILYQERLFPEQEIIKEFFPQVVTFIEMTTTTEVNPSVEYIINCLYAIYDFCAKTENHLILNGNCQDYLYKKLQAFSHLNTVVATFEYRARLCF